MSQDPVAGPGDAAAADALMPLTWGPLLQSHPLAHFVYDTQDLRLRAANPAALSRYGYELQEFLSLTRADLLLPTEVQPLRDFLAGLPASAQAPQQRVWLERTRSGHVLHADVRGLAVLFDGRPARLAAVVDAGARAVLAARAGQADDLLAVAGRMAQLGGWTVDLHKQVVLWSDEVCRLHEVAPGTECELQAAVAFYPGEAATTLRAAVERCMHDGTPFDLELPFVGALGTPRWVRSVGAAVRDASGRVVRIHGAQQDITARHQDAMALQDSRERMAALLAALPDLWMVLDAEGRFAEVSDPHHPSLVAPWPATLGQRCQDVLPAPLAQQALALLQRAHASGQVQAHHLDLVVQNGERRAFEARYVPLPGARTMVVSRDVTETVQLEMRFRAIAESAPIGIFKTDVQGHCTYANPAWLALFGLTRQQGLGGDWLKRLHPDDRGQAQERLLAGTAAPQPLEMVWRLVLPGGQVRHVAAHANPVQRADGLRLGYVGAITDITQARELQAERQAHAVAQEAGRRQSAFMSRVSHELRTPLNAILGFGELLQQDPHMAAARARSYVGYVVQAGRHMLALVDDLLELQRLNEGWVRPALAPLALADLLLACADLLRPLADGAGVVLVAAAPAGLMAVTDERCLRQIVLNLGSNAIKYGGRGAHVVLDATVAAGLVRVTVTDSGPGMSLAQVQRLFQPFDRLGQETGQLPGSGLGLVITRQLAQLLGGDVHIESTPGQGTKATVTLPAGRGADSAPAATAPAR